MFSILLALTLAHHDDANPYGWHMSCERFLQRRVEIQQILTLTFYLYATLNCQDSDAIMLRIADRIPTSGKG